MRGATCLCTPAEHQSVDGRAYGDRRRLRSLGKLTTVCGRLCGGRSQRCNGLGSIAQHSSQVRGAKPDPGAADHSWQRAGITVAGSSDAPVITPDPLTGIRDAIIRRTAAGQVIGPDERLTAGAALALYTAGSAYAMHRETETGSLEPGKLADFTVLDRNPLSADPEQITGIQVLATVVDGTPAYQTGSTAFPQA